MGTKGVHKGGTEGECSPSRLTVSTVGHLPKEVSRLTVYIILHGTRAILREIIDDSGDSGDSDLELEL